MKKIINACATTKYLQNWKDFSNMQTRWGIGQMSITYNVRHVK